MCIKLHCTIKDSFIFDRYMQALVRLQTVNKMQKQAFIDVSDPIVRPEIFGFGVWFQIFVDIFLIAGIDGNR